MATNGKDKGYTVNEFDAMDTGPDVRRRVELELKTDRTTREQTMIRYKENYIQIKNLVTRDEILVYLRNKYLTMQKVSTLKLTGRATDRTPDETNDRLIERINLCIDFEEFILKCVKDGEVAENIIAKEEAEKNSASA